MEHSLSNARPLYVDLDGTLVRTDVFFESLAKTAKNRPFAALAALFSAFSSDKGRAKTVATYYGRIDAETLPYNEEFVAYLRDQKARGRRIVLATAAHMDTARRVARHLGVFDDVIATTSRRNLKGAVKRDAIAGHENGAGFVYAGDSAADAPIWAEASAGVFVNAPASEVKKARAQNKVEREFTPDGGQARALVKAIRPHQWVKNLLIFAPLVASHSYTDLHAVGLAALAFVAFSLCASAVYLTNDLLDLEADRRHPTKRNRPFASGTLFPPFGVIAALALYIAAFALAAVIAPKFLAALVVYFIITTAYSFWIKRKAALDVITLAGLYTMRIIAGAFAVNVELSFWLLAFSMFIFLSLAYVKRYSELAAAADGRSEKSSGRGYSVDDKETVFTLGAVSGFLSVLVIALYINSDQVKLEYPFPEALWLLCPALLYWVNRIWFGARRGKITEDPIVFAIRDRVSLAVGAFCAAVLIGAHYLPAPSS